MLRPSTTWITVGALALLGYTGWSSFKSSHEGAHLKKAHWSFSGPFGTFDKQQLQRGFQVYKEVCSVCHGVKRVAYRHLVDLGLNPAEIKALAMEKEYQDGPNDQGEMFTRKGKPTDYLISPYANDKAARAANNGAFPPDLSLIVKARIGGANYIYSLLTGYTNPPKDFQMQPGLHYNPYFSTKQLSMASPLTKDGQLTYADNTKATVDQMAKDVVTFLAWASEPESEARRRLGIKVIFFLMVMTTLGYLSLRKVRRMHHH